MLRTREDEKSISNEGSRISSKFACVFSFTDVFYDDVTSTIINDMRKASCSNSVCLLTLVLRGEVNGVMIEMMMIYE